MAEIFKAPSKVKLPKVDYANYNHAEAIKNEDKYIEDLTAHLKANGFSGKNVGEIIRIPHADSYAMYMVASMRPLRLIHLALGDACGSQFAELLTAKKVNDMLAAEKKMKELFS